MKKTAKLLALMLASAMTLTACGNEAASTSASTPKTDVESKPASESSAEAVSEEFSPSLDTEKEVELNAAVLFGNFPAFDQVINDFNEIYPNVTISYDQGVATDASFFESNPVDIFMTSTEKGYPQECCVDLLAEGVNVSAVADGMLDSNTVDGKLLSLPMGLILRGVVVNETLLENEGLEMPETWGEFLDVLEALKEKGYTPLQGPSNVVGNLCNDMGMNILLGDDALVKAASEGDAEGASALKVVYERMQELWDKGYLSQEVNAEYPEDNYEGSILKFFEGDVPFWICDTEKVSGMKKRESKSEAYTANPFDYEFTFVPVGDNGVYEYAEPWYGFAVNKDAENLDYALELLRFMAQEDELNTLATVKGVPSITKESPDDLYTGLKDIEKVESSAVYDGSLYSFYSVYLRSAANDMMDGMNADEALEAFVQHCSETIEDMKANGEIS